MIAYLGRDLRPKLQKEIVASDDLRSRFDRDLELLSLFYVVWIQRFRFDSKYPSSAVPVEVGLYYDLIQVFVLDSYRHRRPVVDVHRTATADNGVVLLHLTSFWQYLNRCRVDWMYHCGPENKPAYDKDPVVTVHNTNLGPGPLRSTVAVVALLPAFDSRTTTTFDQRQL